MFVKNKNIIKHGFTLMELLAVVLIIGVLASIASPLYRNAVDKSRWARLISPARSIANAEEAIVLSNGSYTANKDDLAVSLPTNNDLSYTLYTKENGDEANLVRVESSKLEDVRLARHYKKNIGSSNYVFCEAKNDNERANKLCGKLLNGIEMSTTPDGYKAYLIEGTHACLASGMPYDSTTGFCGWIDTPNQTVHAGGVCVARTSSWTAPACNNTTVNNGGECRVEGRNGCRNAQIYDGGKCVTTDTSDGCYESHIYEGGTCLAEGGGCGNSQVDAGGVCEGSYWSSCTRSTIFGVCNGSGEGSCSSSTIEDGGVCNGDGANSCSGSASVYYGAIIETFPLVVKSGGVCNGNAEGACSPYFDAMNSYLAGPGYEYFVQFQSGSVCNGNASGSCAGQFQAGSKCYANVPGACQGDYSQGGCCVGSHCPSGTNC